MNGQSTQNRTHLVIGNEVTETRTPFNVPLPISISKERPVAARHQMLCSVQARAVVVVGGGGCSFCSLLAVAVGCPHPCFTDGETAAHRGHRTLAQGYSANKLGLDPNPFDSKGLGLAAEYAWQPTAGVQGAFGLHRTQAATCWAAPTSPGFC